MDLCMFQEIINGMEEDSITFKLVQEMALIRVHILLA